MPLTPCHTFPKAEKLKSLKQIDLLFKEGRSFFAAPVKCYYRLTGLEVDGLTGLEVDGLTGLEVDRLTGLEVDELTGLEVDGLTSKEGETAETINHKQQTINNKPQTINSEPQTPNLKLQTSNPKQQAINLKCGVSVSKRNFKKAVDRNRIKRLLREAYRIHKAPLQERLKAQQKQLEVFFVFTDRTLPTFDLVEEKMKYCIRRLGKIVEGGT
jgi:ribonuclease P protein component